MIKAPPPKHRGIAGLLLLFCATGAVAGLGFDLSLAADARFGGAAAQPGARAVMGLGVAALLVAVAHAFRWMLGRRVSHGEGARVRDNA